MPSVLRYSDLFSEIRNTAFSTIRRSFSLLSVRIDVPSLITGLS